MKKLAFLNICCLITLSWVAPYTYAQQIEVYTEILPPFQTFHNNHLAGSATEKVKKILHEANLEPQFYVVPWARAFNTVKKNKNTLIYSIQRSPEREPYFHWLSVVAEIKNGFVALKKYKIKLNSIEDAKSYVTAVARDSYPYEYLISQGFSEDKNLLIISSREAQLNLFLSGKVDFLFLDMSSMAERLNTRNLSPLLVEHVLKHSDWRHDLYLAINKNSDANLVNKIKSAAKNQSAP